jgi:hypothetical protein
MTDDCDEMSLRLDQSCYLRSVKSRKYEEEDHGSVIAAALNGVIFYFLDHLRCLYIYTTRDVPKGLGCTA